MSPWVLEMHECAISISASLRRSPRSAPLTGSSWPRFGWTCTYMLVHVFSHRGRSVTTPLQSCWYAAAWAWQNGKTRRVHVQHWCVLIHMQEFVYRGASSYDGDAVNLLILPWRWSSLLQLSIPVHHPPGSLLPSLPDACLAPASCPTSRSYLPAKLPGPARCPRPGSLLPPRPLPPRGSGLSC